MRLIFIGTLLCMSSFLQWAQAQPTAVSADTRLVTFEFDPDQSYLILTRPKMVTHIQLGATEMITTAVAGDTSNFSVVVSANRSSVLVRPKYEGLTTSLTLITNQRSYPIVLRSTPESTGKWYQRVSWHLGEMELDSPNLSNGQLDLMPSLRPPTASLDGVSNFRPTPSNEAQEDDRSSESQSLLSPNPALEAKAPLSLDLDRLSQLRSQYVIAGSADFRPIQVFDDGQRMYLHMPHDMQNFPAIFALEEDQAKLINFSLAKHFVVIQGLHSELLLKNGASQITIKRTQDSKGFFGGLFHGN